MPPALTADTGVDALTHALEADVSIFASPYTDAFCLQAVHLILDALPRAVARRRRPRRRAPTWPTPRRSPGLAFSNAFVGVNHALAHAVGARFGIAHGRANGDLPAARAALQRRAADASSCRRRATRAYVAPEKYAQIAWVLGLGGRDRGGARASGCSRASTSCSTRVGMPRSLEAAGVARDEFEAALPDLARAAFEDPSIRTNPRIPLVHELTELLEQGFHGR